jgi:hypothetical protein
VEAALQDCRRLGILGTVQEVSVTLKEKAQTEATPKKPKKNQAGEVAQEDV